MISYAPGLVHSGLALRELAFSLMTQLPNQVRLLRFPFYLASIRFSVRKPFSPEHLITFHTVIFLLQKTT